MTKFTDPQEGQHVKCFLRNGNVAEGIVETWGTPIVLKSLDSQSLMIIHDPKQDIMLTKVLLVEDKPVSQAAQIAQKIREKAEEGQPESNPIALDAMSKAELHAELAEQERRIVSEKLQTHHPDSTVPRKKMYGYPSFFKQRK